MPKSKLSAFISVLVVFLSGVLVGAVAYRLYVVNTAATAARVNPPPPGRRPDPEEIRKRLVKETRERCNLDDEQVARLNQLYDDERKEFDQMHQRWNAEGRALRAEQSTKIKALLRPDQVPLFDQLQAEREERHQRRLREQQNVK